MQNCEIATKMKSLTCGHPTPTWHYFKYFSRPEQRFSPTHKVHATPTHTHTGAAAAQPLKLGLNSEESELPELTKQAASLPKLSKLRYPQIDYPQALGLPTPHEYRKSRSSTLACDPLAHRALHLHGRASSLSFSIRVHVVF